MQQNALLRSGKGLSGKGLSGKGLSEKGLSEKGLGTSGAARKNNPAIEASAPSDESADHFCVRNGVLCAGVHLLIDLYGAQRLNDIEHIEETLRKCVAAAKATLLHMHLHHFQPNGVSGVAVLAESHISIHTWPEIDFAALDVFMCGRADPDACLPVFREAFKPKSVVVRDLLRGQES
jgi:S-adenosylmethionine decarboxylase